MDRLPALASARLRPMTTRNEGAIATDRDPSVATTPKRMAAAGRRPPASIAMRLAIGILLVVAALASTFGLGFLWFATRVAWSDPPADARADGIVVLTGGRDRVQGAVDLLEAGRGRRLLISGVHPTTRAEDIRRATVAAPNLFACCVDLGHRAETTVGNAREAADWTRANGFTSLIVVTSAYHMPRSMAELDKALPGVRKVAWPVKRPELAVESWFLHPQTTKLLMHEYVKYIVTRFGPAASTLRPSDPATTVSLR